MFGGVFKVVELGVLCGYWRVGRGEEGEEGK